MGKNDKKALRELKDTKSTFKSSKSGSHSLPPLNIRLNNLPVTDTNVFGREEEINSLNDAWNDEKVGIVTIVAPDGSGKTALVNAWLSRMPNRCCSGVTKVYAWSFYCHGAEEGKQTSTDFFFNDALSWFGDTELENKDPISNGRRLANLIKKEKCLVILDGLESQQYLPQFLSEETGNFAGVLKDNGLKVLLKELSGGYPGLCVITTREVLKDLSGNILPFIKEIYLENLSEEAGFELLKGSGITRWRKEMRAAVHEYNGHPFSLKLLGNYIMEVYEGDIRKRRSISFIRDNSTMSIDRDDKLELRLNPILAAFEKWLSGRPELDILQMMAFFEGPISMTTVNALRGNYAIKGLTSELKSLPHAKWQTLLDRLIQLGLLTKQAVQERKIEVLNCHPLIRRYFRETLKENNPIGWKKGHKRLYHYYKNLPKSKLPDTLEEMKHLFSAVVHGCAAGLHMEALDDVYWKRIKRGNENFCTSKLNASSTDLASLSHFFDVPWSRPAAGLTSDIKTIVLSWAAFRLISVGRLCEALDPMKTELDILVRREHWNQAAVCAGNLSELILILGNVKSAVDYARESVSYADRSDDWGQRMGKRTTLADALHRFGAFEEAEAFFVEAENMKKLRQPEYPYLYSLWGYRYSDLLLEKGNYKEVIRRTERTIEIVKENTWLLDIALDSLLLGRAYILQFIETHDSKILKQAYNYLVQALEGVRKSGRNDYLPAVFFAMAALYRMKMEFDKAWKTLDEVHEVIELEHMRLYLCDYHLEAGRLCEAEGRNEDARNHFKTARIMIRKMNYHRRDKELPGE